MNKKTENSPQFQSIPLQRPSVGEEEIEAIRAVLDTGWLGLGPVVKEFEEKVADLVGARNVIAVNTGTSALHIALDAFGVGVGDEVIVPSFTYVATVQAVIQCGATPVFCDIDENTLNMDIDDAARRITLKTKVILPVHYGGLPCDMAALNPLCRDKNILLIEDAAHAFGSKYRGTPIGTFGDATCFSFDPIKNITCGEGGAVCTESDETAARIRTKRILGVDKETWRRYEEKRGWLYQVTVPGYRYHMSNINAAIGICQLAKLEQFLERKRYFVKRYDEALANVNGIHLLSRDYEETAPFFYVIRIKDRDRFADFMKNQGVDVGIHYTPNHLQPLFKEFYTVLPVTEKAWKEIITLPLFSEMTEEIFDTVVSKIKEFCRA
jgi:perosamine synthetase